MCYPCTMCNGCGKLDHGIGMVFAKRKGSCSQCGEMLPEKDHVRKCPSCGAPVPLPPGVSQSSFL